MVLLALVDANYRFIGLEIGAPGSSSDAGIFDRSRLGRFILRGLHGIPSEDFLPGAQYLGKLPYVVVGDEGFPLRHHLMRPFSSHNSTESQRIFNYRLSHARRVSENAFGQLASRWRVFHSPLAVDPPLAKKIVKASCLLHNILCFDGDEQEAIENGRENFVDFEVRPCGRGTQKQPSYNRSILELYFKNINTLEWQLDSVRCGSHS